MSGFAVEKVTSLEVVAAWVAPKRVVPAVASSPGWYVMGEYYLPKSTMAQLDVVGCVSDASLTLRARLWDVQAAAPVPGEVQIKKVDEIGRASCRERGEISGVERTLIRIKSLP